MKSNPSLSPDAPLAPAGLPDVTVPADESEGESPRTATADSGQREISLSADKTVYPILFAISFSHLLNDTMQSLIPSIYPLVKDDFSLSFTQIGLITLVFQLAASLLQPFVGLYTDRKPQPYSLAAGMGSTLAGLVMLATATSFPMLLIAVGLVGMGSSVFHPEASRMAYLSSGGRRGLAQSVFQVGGNAGSAFGPLLAALIIVPYGRGSVIWFSLIALLAMGVLTYVGGWYKSHIISRKAQPAHAAVEAAHNLPRHTIWFTVFILLMLIFSKFFYMACMTSYFTFFQIEKFGVSVEASQTYLFVFLAAVAVGTLAGGPIGDRFGRKYVIWASILGAAPFTIMLPYVNLFWTAVLIIIIGIVMSSAFSAILVYAQELVPGKVGLVSGLFFGFAFGMAGIGAAVLGKLADFTSIDYVYKVCSYLPLIGLLTGFLPNIESTQQRMVKRLRKG